MTAHAPECYEVVGEDLTHHREIPTWVTCSNPTDHSAVFPPQYLSILVFSFLSNEWAESPRSTSHHQRPQGSQGSSFTTAIIAVVQFSVRMDRPSLDSIPHRNAQTAAANCKLQYCRLKRHY